MTCCRDACRLRSRHVHSHEPPKARLAPHARSLLGCGSITNVRDLRLVVGSCRVTTGISLEHGQCLSKARNAYQPAKKKDPITDDVESPLPATTNAIKATRMMSTHRSVSRASRAWRTRERGRPDVDVASRKRFSFPFAQPKPRDGNRFSMECMEQQVQESCPGISRLQKVSVNGPCCMLDAGGCMYVEPSSLLRLGQTKLAGLFTSRLFPLQRGRSVEANERAQKRPKIDLIFCRPLVLDKLQGQLTRARAQANRSMVSAGLCACP